MYEARWQAAGTARALAASAAAMPVVRVGLPGRSLAPRQAGKHSAGSVASRGRRLAAAGQLPEGRGLAIAALAGASISASRLLSAGLHLAQRATSAAAGSLGLLSRGTGMVQPMGSARQAGTAGMAALLKVAAAEHPGTGFSTACVGPMAAQFQPSLARVGPPACHAGPAHRPQPALAMPWQQMLPGFALQRQTCRS